MDILDMDILNLKSTLFLFFFLLLIIEYRMAGTIPSYRPPPLRAKQHTTYTARSLTRIKIFLVDDTAKIKQHKPLNSIT